jgi:phage terminase large subunit
MGKFDQINNRTKGVIPTPQIQFQIRNITELNSINGYRPTRKQLQAHRTRASYILFGGAMGGGKSAWLCNESIFHCLKFPGSRVYLARNELASLKKTTLITLMDFLPYSLVKKHNKSDCFIHFKNDSIIFYGGLGDDIRSIEKLKSMELSMFAIDQAEETTENFFHMLNSRLRLNIPRIRYKGLLTSNPTGNWVRARFIDRQIEDHAFIPALPNENPHLPSNYEERLRETLPEELVKAWIDGNWDIIAADNNVFKYDEIMDAMRRSQIEDGQECIAADISRYGSDETVIVRKRGNTITYEEVLAKKSTMETAGRIIQLARNDTSIPIKVDAIGVGAGVADRLKEQGFNVVEVIGSQTALNNQKFKNRRAENYWNLRDLLPQLSIPNDEKLRAQMMSVRYRIFSDGLIIIESKDEMKKRGLTSPDRLDAIVIACSKKEPIIRDEWQYGLFEESISPEEKLERDSILWLLGKEPSKKKAEDTDDIDESEWDVNSMSLTEIEAEIRRLERNASRASSSGGKNEAD